LIAYYKVIDRFNVEMLACRHQLLRYSNIFWVRRGVAAGILFQRMSPWKVRMMTGRKISAVRKTELLIVP
jgi:hypothetical protein